MIKIVDSFYWKSKCSHHYEWFYHLLVIHAP